MRLRAVALAAALALGAAGAAAQQRVHVVRPGESLASIAEQELGDRMLWHLVYKANRDRIKDPARIYPGQELTIPPREPTARAAPPPPPAVDEDDE